jgi:hypothetical protein
MDLKSSPVTGTHYLSSRGWDAPQMMREISVLWWSLGWQGAWLGRQALTSVLVCASLAQQPSPGIAMRLQQQDSSQTVPDWQQLRTQEKCRVSAERHAVADLSHGRPDIWRFGLLASYHSPAVLHTGEPNMRSSNN